MTPQRLAALLDTGGAQLVDVRDAEEYDAGRLAGARHIPFDRLDAAAAELDRSAPVVFYCRGGDRSAIAAAAFAASGWNAHSLDGGLVAWAQEGKSLEPDGGRVVERSGLPPA